MKEKSPNQFSGLLNLMRPKEWAKNLFLFLPIFFAGKSFELNSLLSLFGGFFCFSLVASGLYILNDIRDLESDRQHPIKKNRPLASKKIRLNTAKILMVTLWSIGLILSYFLKAKFAFILGMYWFLNLGYSMGLKNISILDILMISVGFVLRVKGGGVLSGIYISTWLTIMVFLISLFMAIGKRRDDVLLKLRSGLEVRKASKGYNLEFLNIALGLVSGITVVAYLMYTLSPEVMARHNSFRLYYTCVFVLAGILRYLQITFVEDNSGSPTSILYKDRFIQLCLVLWIISFYFILYVPDIKFFNN